MLAHHTLVGVLSLFGLGLPAAAAEPGVLQELGGGAALVRVDDEHLVQQVPRLLGHVLRRLVLTTRYLLVELLVRCPLEGEVPAEQRVEENACRPDVSWRP